MAGQNLGLVDSVVVEEPVRHVGRRPDLADERDALAGIRGKLLEPQPKTLAELPVLELAARTFTIDPVFGRTGPAEHTASALE